MAGDGKSADRILSRFGLRGRGRAVPNIPSTNRPSTSGVTPKRTFAPKIVERSVKKEEITDSKHPQFKSRRGSGRGSGRGRGRGRGNDNIIQTDGVFSHGLFSQPTLAKALCGGERYGGGGGGGNGGGGGPAVTMKMKCEERDAFVESDKVEETMGEDGKLDMDSLETGSLAPVTLPLGSKVPPALKRDSMKLKREMMKEEKVKKEIPKTEDEGVNATTDSDVPKETKLADLFKSESSEGEQLLFFQFPDALPIKPISQDDPVKTEDAEGTESKDDVTDNHSVTDQLKRFTFKNVSEGFIGRLAVHKSGKVKMHLGNVALDVSLGTPCGFLQDLVSVRTDREPAEMISLGHIQHRLIACPDYKALLGSVTT